MASRRRHPEHGFTIVEMLIALSLFFLILGGLFSVFGPSNVIYATGQRKMDAQQNVRVAMDRMARQIRMAGYYPENFDTNGSANDVPAANQNAIHVGTATALAIFGAANGCLDADANGLCDGNQTGRSQVFLFCLTGTMLLSKVGPLGAAASYNCADPGQTQVVADNITTLTFSYYDGNNNLLPTPLDGQALGLPNFVVNVNRTAVRTIIIRVTAQETVVGQPNPIVYTLSSDVRLRNL